MIEICAYLLTQKCQQLVSDLGQKFISRFHTLQYILPPKIWSKNSVNTSKIPISDTIKYRLNFKKLRTYKSVFVLFEFQY